MSASSINQLRCYADKSEEFPIIKLQVNVQPPGIIYLVCDAKKGHVNKIAISSDYQTGLNEFDYSNEINKVQQLDKATFQLLSASDYPNFLLNNYVEIKNAYLLGSKAGVAAGTRFFLDRFVYSCLAPQMEMDENEIRTLGVDKTLKIVSGLDPKQVLKDPTSPFQKEKIPIAKKIHKWITEMDNREMLPAGPFRTNLPKAYQNTSDELHNGMISEGVLYDAFETVMNFLVEYQRKGNVWKEVT